MKDIKTATIYATPEEWKNFKRNAAKENRREAAQLVFLAKEAAEHPELFCLTPRPKGGKPNHQIKTRGASQYLIALADAVFPSGTVTLSEIAETLVRGFTQQTDSER